MDHAQASDTPLVIVDWGTTSFRAYLVSVDGTIAASLETESGIQSVADGGYETVLCDTIRPWTDRHGALQIVALGMITSRNGWVEVPYVACPAGVTDFAAGTHHLTLSGGSTITFLPGLTDLSGFPFPDVMRGEETQLAGFGLEDELTLVLPGTHSKWARVGAGRIQRFQTFITGEMYALFSRHSFVARAGGAEDGAENPAAFERGVALAADKSQPAYALSSLIFSARTGMLSGDLEAGEIRDYLSGLLIGSEFRQAQDAGWFRSGDEIGIVGNDGLNDRYARASSVFGLTLRDGGEMAAITGARRIMAAVVASD